MHFQAESGNEDAGLCECSAGFPACEFLCLGDGGLESPARRTERLFVLCYFSSPHYGLGINSLSLETSWGMSL